MIRIPVKFKEGLNLSE